ncbi:MAG: M14-type cytosolic carboxypeptidase [Planctomycetota bacterium]|nr:M14-type cytosolic carboxypeptidase [Planctomycetota bacterium]
MKPTLTLLTVLLLAPLAALDAAEPLTVISDFEGASVSQVEIDGTARSISFRPGGDSGRGWPCWWYFRVNGITPGETITLRLRGNSPAETKSTALAAIVREATAFSMPAQATFSPDGRNWRQTETGTKEGDVMTYTIKADAASLFVAWGPPYTPSTAAAFVRAMSEKSRHARVEELCRSREGRSVPMLRVQEGGRTESQRFGVWVQARQHAWESGSSWVAQGFGEWLVSDAPEAAWLRQHAEILLVPIMDIDNTATGNGGKDAQPHDHNRDWSERPHWNEVVAAKEKVSALIKEGRMDVFLDLHNPAPGDPSFFYILESSTLKEPMIGLRDRFIALAYERISKIQPLIPMSNKPKTTGAAYHPLWQQISANWVSMNGNPHTVSVCLETIWNYKNSNTEGYRAVGANLAAAVREYLAERPERR